MHWLGLLVLLIMIFPPLWASEIQKYEFNRFSMNTFFQMTLYSDMSADRVRSIVEEAWEEIAQLERKYSTTKRDSVVSLLNLLKFYPDADGEFIRILKKALHYSEVSGGFYDITVQPLMKLWGFYTLNPTIPNKSELSNLLKRVSYSNIQIRNSKIYLKNNARIDLGSIIKGYAVDKMVDILMRSGILAGLVNAGGNLKTFGQKADNSPWKIGIRHPRKTGDLIKVIKIPKGKSIATSGDYEQFFMDSGLRYHHILNPKTGYPIWNGVCSVSVIADSAEDTDVLSTVLFTMGVEKGLEYANQNRLPVLYIIEVSNVLIITNSLYWSD